MTPTSNWNPSGLSVYSEHLITHQDRKQNQDCSQNHTHTLANTLLTHVQCRHAPLWCSRVHGGHAGGHEVCNLLQSQEAGGCLALLQLVLDHGLQLITESLQALKTTTTHKSVRGKWNKNRDTQGSVKGEHWASPGASILLNHTKGPLKRSSSPAFSHWQGHQCWWGTLHSSCDGSK